MLNKNLYKIEKENAFSKSSRLVKEYKESHPDEDIISLGIGDVSKPIVPPIIEAMKKALDDLSDEKTFQGYGLYYGLESLRNKIVENEYKDFNISVDEVFIGDGTKSDSTNLLELFDVDSKILLGDPVYPIYLNGSYSYSRKIYFADVDNNYKMIVPKEHFDIIYICSPCNPCGNAYTYDEIKKWVDYANKNKSIILFDSVYRSFIESYNVPKTIYEIEGAKTCSIELRSFSKDASFTSMRCSYYVLPKEIHGDILEVWKERTINRFNGATYVSQKGAEASFTKEARELISKNIREYKENAKYLKEELTKLNMDVIGGVDSPYLWVKMPYVDDSWEAFHIFLEKMNIVVVPGIVFGKNGKDRVRISSLGNIENSKKAIKRIKKYYETKNI